MKSYTMQPPNFNTLQPISPTTSKLKTPSADFGSADFGYSLVRQLEEVIRFAA